MTDFNSVFETFRRDGYLVLPSILSPQLCESLRHECSTLLEQLLSLPDNESGVHSWQLPSGEWYIFKVKPIVGVSPPLAALADHPTLQAILRGFLRGCPKLIEHKLMLKQVVNNWAPKGERKVIGPEVHRHLDSTYFIRRGFSPDVISSGFLLDDCGLTSGPLLVWPGSHNREVTIEDSVVSGPIVPSWEAPDDQAVSLVAPQGSLLLWHSRTIHASQANTSGRPRRLLVFGHDHG